MALFSKEARRSREKLSDTVRLSVIRRHKKVAEYLNRRTQYWNRASKIIFLVVLIILFGGFSLWLIVEACI